MSHAPSNHGFFRYQIGDVNLTALHDGLNRRPLDGLLRNASVAEAEVALAEAGLPTDALPITFTPLVIENSGELTLIDTGNGDMGSETNGFMLENLKAAGYAPTDIKNVVISHFHGDHINGLRSKNGFENFPHARILVPDAEWQFWMEEAPVKGLEGMAATQQKNAERVFLPMHDRVEKFSSGDEIVPGLTALAAPGHTPGHSAFQLRSADTKLLILSDIINHPALFARHPDWSPTFDILPELAVTTRKKFLGLAEAKKTQVAFFHAPFPATGFIEKAQGGFRFIPIGKN